MGHQLFSTPSGMGHQLFFESKAMGRELFYSMKSILHRSHALIIIDRSLIVVILNNDAWNDNSQALGIRYMTTNPLCITDMNSEELGCASRSLHVVMNRIIGPEIIVNIRRTTTNLWDDIKRMESELGDEEYIVSYSGSKGEGLRFVSSDDDWMLIFRKIIVLPSDSCIPIYDRNRTLFLMENELTKPGFTLLRLLGETADPIVTLSIESILNGRYLSCKRWRELNTMGMFTDDEFTHGPCVQVVR